MIIKPIFWNSNQNRIRSGYRIILQLTLFFILMKSLKLILGIPNTFQGNTSLEYIFLGGIVRLLRVAISVWISCRIFERRPITDLGLSFNNKWWINLGFGIGLGILMMSIVFVIELSFGWVTITDTFFTGVIDRSFILSFIVFSFFFACVGFSEELASRGYHLTNFAEGMNFKTLGSKIAIIIAVIFSSLLFGLFHLGNSNANLISTLGIILWVFLFTLPFILTGSLAISIGIHFSWNLFQGCVFGFPVSGHTFPMESVSIFQLNKVALKFGLVVNLVPKQDY